MSAFQGWVRVVYRIGLVLLVIGTAAIPPVTARAADFVVGTGTAGSCTEAAFNTAFYAAQAAGGTITFKCGAAPVTILFSTKKEVSANTVIQGGSLVTLSGANTVGLFQIFSGKTLTLNQITITRGYGGSGAVENFGTLTITNSQVVNNTSTDSGGGLLNHGTLNVEKSTLSGNSSAVSGGAIYSTSGTVTVTNSTVTGNMAFSGGGGIAAAGDTSLLIASSKFESNRATDTFAQGGAVLNGEATANTSITGSTFVRNNSSRGGALSVLDGTVSIDQSIFEGNWAAYGGAIRHEGGSLALNRSKLTGNGYSSTGSKVTTGGGALSWGNGTATLTNVTISNNWASYGGGFDHENGITTLTNVTISGNTAVGAGGFDTNGGTTTLINSTVANNSALFFGGGIGNRNGTIVLKNTLLSGNTKTDTSQNWNCNKFIGSTPFSLSSDYTCGLGAGRDNVTIQLGMLREISPLIQVHKLGKSSPAIDTGLGADCPQTDQRGGTRPQGEACDIGAVEFTTGDLAHILHIPFVVR